MTFIEMIEYMVKIDSISMENAQEAINKINDLISQDNIDLHSWESSRFGSFGYHLLCMASKFGSIELVGTLIEQGVKVEHWGIAEPTQPIHRACIHGHAEIVAKLIQEKADVNNKYITDTDGLNSQEVADKLPEMLAIKNGHINVLAVFIMQGTALHSSSNISKVFNWAMKKQDFILSEKCLEQLQQKLAKHENKFNKAKRQLDAGYHDIENDIQIEEYVHKQQHSMEKCTHLLSELTTKLNNAKSAYQAKNSNKMKMN
jgi:uncharacterized coiled-coil protein SlyX